MNLTKKLLKIDANKYTELKTKEVEIEHLTQEFGEPFIVKIKQLSDKRLAEIQAEILTEDGKLDFSKGRDTYAQMVCDSIIEPNLGDDELQTHFKACSPLELADILFKGDSLSNLAHEITSLSELKNIDVKK